MVAFPRIAAPGSMPHDIAEDARDARWITHHRQVPGFERCERKLLEFIARALERLMALAAGRRRQCTKRLGV